MAYLWRKLAAVFGFVLLVLSLGGCGGSPWRYEPGVAQSPTGVVATAGDGKVSLSWSTATGATGYSVYYGTVAGVTAANGVKIADIDGSPAVVSGLSNGTRYYFAVTAVNSNGESSLSGEVSSIPSPPGPFRQSDLQGSWRFNALVSGVGAKWMRGTVDIDASGSVSVASFLDSAGNSAAPADLFSRLAILPDGSVFQDGAASGFHGALSANLHKDLLVATASAGGSSPMLAILQKIVPGIVFSAADIKGTCRLGAGPLSYVYHQLSSGASAEWEHAGCQVGQDQGVTYLALDASTPRALPGGGGKVVTLSITDDGIVTESRNAGVLPQPAALLTHAVMSADKMTVVGTATDLRGAYVLRVMQLVHPPAVLMTPSDYLLADLAGSYSSHALIGAAAPFWAHGTQTVAASGAASFTAYLTAGGDATLPGPATLVLDQQGVLTDPAAPTYNGQFSYFHDLVVATQTDAAGGAGLSIALKGNQ